MTFDQSDSNVKTPLGKVIFLLIYGKEAQEKSVEKRNAGEIDALPTIVSN